MSKSPLRGRPLAVPRLPSCSSSIVRSPRASRRAGVAFVLLALALTRFALSSDFTLTQPIAITSTYHSVVPSPSDPRYLLDNYRTSANASKQMAFDSKGTLHLAYWSGFSQTNPDSPSAVYYQSWHIETGWSSQTLVDQSHITGDPTYEGRRMGARHPSLSVGPDDRVWIAWQDHRHCGVGAPYNGIDNIEIYCDSKPSTGSFSDTDTRLTQTAAGHNGDSGYAARVHAAPNGKVSVMWYDFFFDGGVSDIFMMTSDDTGVFNTAATMASRRLTDTDDRKRLPDRATKAPFTMPDFCIDASNQRYAVWTHGFGGSFDDQDQAPIYFAEPGETPAIASYTTVASDTDSFWYPPKIEAAPNGDLWIAYTKVYNTFDRRIEAVRRRNGQATFDAPVPATAGTADQNADLAIDSEGRLHLVWIGDAGFSSGYVRYAMLSSDGQSVLRQDTVTAVSGAWAAPCIQLDSDDVPYIVFCEGNSDLLGEQGDIWFVRGISQQAAPGTPSAWLIY